MIDFEAHCAAVTQHIERRYGIRVWTKDVRDPLTGNLDGAEIHIDYAVSPELRLFLLAHLFGHTVQWNVDSRNVDIGQLLEPPVEPGLLRDVLDYERQATAYSMTMLHEAGVRDADQWLADLSACDQRYLDHYYRTGEKRDFLSFFAPGAPLVQPIPIPPFTPRPRRFERNGLVI